MTAPRFVGLIVTTWIGILIFFMIHMTGYSILKPDIKVGDVYQTVKVSEFASDPDEVTQIEITEISKDGEDVRYIYKMIDNKAYNDDQQYQWKMKKRHIYRNYEKINHESNRQADRTM
ncbi:hypothetical protein [Vibrio phage XZ1]|nr:hypothetical protein [Vibrio phage XZ1]